MFWLPKNARALAAWARPFAASVILAWVALPGMTDAGETALIEDWVWALNEGAAPEVVERVPVNDPMLRWTGASEALANDCAAWAVACIDAPAFWSLAAPV